jgi:hypothetical protein
MICAGLFRCVSVGAIGGGEMGQKKRRCNVYKFATPAQVMRFANVFVRQRTSDFKKNVDICLAARKTRLNDVDHAYMPGLMTCLSFLDLLSGLYAGKVRGHNDVHFLDFTRRFFPKGRYEEDHLRLLYIEFRHKLAHLAHPYFVLDAPPNLRSIEKETYRDKIASEKAAVPATDPMGNLLRLPVLRER